MSKIEALKDDYNRLKKTRDGEGKSLVCSKEECGKEIYAFRKELDTFLDDLEKSVLKLLDSQDDEWQNRIGQHIATLTETLKMLETDNRLLQDAKSNGGQP